MSFRSGVSPQDVAAQNLSHADLLGDEGLHLFVGSRGPIQAGGPLGGESSPMGVSLVGGAVAIVMAAGP